MKKTEQELFWGGKFGDDYVDRNRNGLQCKIALFSSILRNMNGKVNSALELGSNIGVNLKALKALSPDIICTAVEINEKAAKECGKLPDVHVINKSIFDFDTDEKYDLTFTCGVLIHINPDKLNLVYDTLYKNSQKYILIAEYYNPTPMEVLYRGNEGKLFKRDFAGEFMERFKHVRLVDYGFVYHKDVNFPLDDITWFLIEKM